jgi:uncharacterized protein involved in exopolysaccharide biosynthesis
MRDTIMREAETRDATTRQPVESVEPVSDVSLHEILEILRRHKWSLIIASLLGLGVSVLYVSSVSPWFHTEVLLKPTEEKNGGGAGATSDAAGALASLTGISLSSGNRTAEPMALLTARQFDGEFIQDKNLLPVLFARKWDAQKQQWKPSRFFNPPDLRDGEEYFRNRIVNVLENKKTGLITLNVEWKNPKQAAEWANELVDRVNERMRERALRETQYNVDYLKAELASTNVVVLQQSISRLLESEMQKLMLAKGNKEFSFRVVDPAQIPKLRVGPGKPLILTEGLFGGYLLWAFVLIGRYFLHRSRPHSP